MGQEFMGGLRLKCEDSRCQKNQCRSSLFEIQVFILDVLKRCRRKRVQITGERDNDYKIRLIAI